MSAVLDMLYPRNCIGCAVAAPEPFRYICWDCWSATNRVVPPFCDLCGDPVAGSVDHEFICYACSAEKPSFDGARSAARYDGAVGEALRQLKYGKAFWLVPDLAEIMYNCLRAEFGKRVFDAVVPVPLFHARRRERGYNQSAILAHALGRRIGTKCRPDLLRRIRPTATQTHLTASQRLSNVNNAFVPGKARRLEGRRILLIDDVMTTGATVNACAKALKKGGGASVHVLTVARG